MKKKNIGSTFDSWLREEGLYEEVSATAIKRVVARQVEAAMQQKGLTKAEMARRMHTSRAALDRLLDPDNGAVTLSTLQKAAIVVGREIRLDLVDPLPCPRPSRCSGGLRNAETDIRDFLNFRKTLRRNFACHRRRDEPQLIVPRP
jgi:antitoxin HicB